MTDLTEAKKSKINFDGPAHWHGYWIRVEDGADELILYISLVTGAERIYLNNKLVSKSNHLVKRAILLRNIWLRADVGQDQYIVDLMTSDFLRYRLDYLVRKNGRVLAKGHKMYISKLLSGEGFRKMGGVLLGGACLGFLFGTFQHGSSPLYDIAYTVGQFLKPLFGG